MKPAAPAQAAIEVLGLEVRYAETVAVEAATLRAAPHRILALVGPSGCGKTTLLRAVAGFERPRAGEVRIDGRLVASPERWVAPERRRVGMVFQEGALFPHMTVADNVRYGVAKFPDAEGRAREALRRVGLERLVDRYPDQLSGGQQQLVALARALAPSPAVVLLDEPFASLDATLRQALREEVRSVLAGAGTTAILVTHDQEEALSLADELAVMARGRILQTGPPDQVYRDPASPEVAEFIGGGQLVRCTVRGRRIECCLGSLRTEAPDGDGLLLVRAEDVVIAAGRAEGGVEGEVVRRRFFGHDLLHEVRLRTGEHVSVRTSAEGAFDAGVGVRVALLPKPLRYFDGARGGRHAALPLAPAAGTG